MTTAAVPPEPHRRFPLLGPEAMTAEQQQVVAAIVAARAGRGRSGPHPLAGPYSALVRSPAVAESCALLGECVRFGSAVPPALNELAILTVARHWSAAYIWAAHAPLAVAAGLHEAVIESLAGAGAPAGLSPAEQTVHDFASQLLVSGTVAPAAFEQAHELLGERGVVDLIAAVGYYSLIAFVLNVDGTPPPDTESKSVAAGLQPVVQNLSYDD